MSLSESLKNKLDKELKNKVAYTFDAPDESVSDVKLFIPTGCTELNYKIKNAPGGGIPVGKITELHGLPATGKSLMAMQIMANAQKMGGYCIYIDTEKGLNTEFATRVGLDVTQNFLHIPEATVEEVFTIIRSALNTFHDESILAKKNKEESNKFLVIVWDSIAATNPKVDLTTENPDPTATIGLKARILGKNVPQLLSLAWKQNTAFIFINQLRAQIGTMPGQDPWVTPGGKAVPFYSSLRIRLTSTGKMRASDEEKTVFGIKTRAEIKKNRFGPPYRKAEYPIYFSYGIDDEESIVDCLLKFKKIRKAAGGPKGSQYSFKNQTKEDQCGSVEFKRRIRLNEPMFSSKSDFKSPRPNFGYRDQAIEFLNETLVVDLRDPREIELEVVSDEQLATEAEK